MRTGAQLDVEYLTLAALAASRPRDMSDVLGIAAFASDRPTLASGDTPLVWVATPPLGNSADVCEVWRSSGVVRSGRAGLVQYRTDGQVVFGCASLSESGSHSNGAGAAELAAVAEQVYAEVFACLSQLGFPHLLRIWNYLPEINRETGGIERYRCFNEARQRSFAAFRRATRGNVPAACALGSTAGSPVVVYFIAAGADAIAIENPRQVSAYDYPAEYGASSPTFSRATLARSGGEALLFVSGTASIVGHRTEHAGDVSAQTRETARNLAALIERANHAAGQTLFATEDLKYKAYLRRPDDLTAVAQEIANTLRPSDEVVYLTADICRSDLLVEIEAVGTADGTRRRAK